MALQRLARRPCQETKQKSYAHWGAVQGAQKATGEIWQENQAYFLRNSLNDCKPLSHAWHVEARRRRPLGYVKTYMWRQVAVCMVWSGVVWYAMVCTRYDGRLKSVLGRRFRDTRRQKLHAVSILQTKYRSWCLARRCKRRSLSAWSCKARAWGQSAVAKQEQATKRCPPVRLHWVATPAPAGCLGRLSEVVK